MVTRSVVTRFHSSSLVVPLVVTRCTSHCRSLSLVVPLVCLFINDLKKRLYDVVFLNWFLFQELQDPQ